MIEAVVIATLRADATLAGTVSTHNGKPSIFADQAPEATELPYIVIREGTMSKTADSLLFAGELYVDYWAFGPSWATCDIASERVETIFDNMKLQSDRLSDIRFAQSSSGPVTDPDPRVIHHNTIFTIRATRKRWILNH
jgi:hypothetical protein